MDCMNHCASSDDGSCFGIWYNVTDSTCWQLDRSVYNATRISSGTDNVAVTPYSQWRPPKDTSCPLEDGFKYTTENGDEFDIICDKDFAGFGDMCAYSLGPYMCHPHTDTLAECLEICSQAHPLCKGVSWNPDMGYGYDNCYLKADPDAGTPISGVAVTHSARVTEGYANVGTYCPDDLSYTSGAGADFNVKCYDGRFNAANFTSLHETSIEGCMDQCASHSGGQDCSGVLFNFDFKDGWDNCYLLNEVGVANKPFNYTFAELVTKDDDQSSGGSKAWIAGPAIGGVVVIALVAAAFWWFRRRRSRADRTPDDFLEKLEQEPQPAFEPIYEIDNHEQAHMLDADSRRHELRDQKSEATVQHELES